jgi:hypothetical protein
MRERSNPALGEHQLEARRLFASHSFGLMEQHRAAAACIDLRTAKALGISFPSAIHQRTHLVID